MLYHDPAWPKPATHWVNRYSGAGKESTQCFCAATQDHLVGEEVAHDE